MPMTVALSFSYSLMPFEISQNSVVQTPVKAIGTNRRRMFELPRFSESLNNSGPAAPRVARVKSGALDPTESAMMVKEGKY